LRIDSDGANLPVQGRASLTVRAVTSGMLIGAALAPCNIYSGLKIGWSFNVSIIALLVASGFWATLGRLRLAGPLAAGEANIVQTAASSSANIISGGLVAPIPALAMLSGGNLPLPQLIAWVFAVSFLGIWVAWYLRASLILRSDLPFPTGRATAETLREIFAEGHEAAIKLRVLLGTTLLAGLLKWADSAAWINLPRPGLGFVLPASGRLAGYAGISAKNLTFTLDPSLLLAGFGAIIGFRNGVSLLLGGVVSWGLLGPWGLARGYISAGANDPDASWFAVMIEWLLWPGVALMVGSALTRFVLQAIARRQPAASVGTPEAQDTAALTRLAGLACAAFLVVMAQITIFDIHWVSATLAVPIAFLLAIVASRVVGETGIPPIGAIGKVAQLSTTLTAPGDTTANLMGANVTGGAAGQSADLLNDLKVGHLIGMPPRLQVVAQFFGILTGSVTGSIVYLRLIPDPADMLITEKWPAPAVATWKVVAEALSSGLATIPPSALIAVLAGGGLGIAGAWLQQHREPAWLPNLPAFGLAMVIPASISITMFLGSLTGRLLERYRPRLAERFLIAAASGLIAGESLTGVARAMTGIVR
jgi:putative OPT family oligopeptide transporter